MIGLMGSMMGMEWRLGREVVGIGGSIDKGLGMVLVYIGFILEMCMLVSGQMGRAMAVELILARMVAAMLANLSGALSMAVATTISGTGTHMPENTLQIRCTDLESIVLLMGIVMREPGMRAEGKVLGCTLLEMRRLNRATGKTGFLMSQALRTLPFLYPLSQFTTPKYSMQSRKHAKQQRRHMM